jgi:hypothetical protein
MTWGEPPAGYEEPPLELRMLSQDEIDSLDDLQRLVWESYGRKLPVNEVERFLAARRAAAGALAKLRALRRPLPDGFRFDRDEANER